MVTNDSVPPFTEIFNTYGERLTNAQLLVRYGFLLDGNEHDVLDWSVDEMCGLVPPLLRGLHDEIGVRSSEVDEETFATSADVLDDAVDLARDDKKREKVVREMGSTLNDVASAKKDDEHFDLSTGPAMNHNSLGKRAGQVVLEQLEDISAVWQGCNSAFSRSSLIFIPEDCKIAHQPSNRGKDGDGLRNRFRTDCGPSCSATFDFSHEQQTQEGDLKFYCVSHYVCYLYCFSFLSPLFYEMISTRC